jgi:hypothetical protein
MSSGEREHEECEYGDEYGEEDEEKKQSSSTGEHNGSSMHSNIGSLDKTLEAYRYLVKKGIIANLGRYLTLLIRCFLCRPE